MERVLGIGGFFYRAKDVQALAQWYEDNLGFTKCPTDYDMPAWRQSGGTTVYWPFSEDTEYFGEPSQQWMINFRVRDLDAMTKQLEAAGTKVTFEGKEPNGRFARLNDPEGNPIQLWEPKGKAADTEEPI